MQSVYACIYQGYVCEVCVCVCMHVCVYVCVCVCVEVMPYHSILRFDRMCMWLRVCVHVCVTA